ncbi:MAG: ParB/RepB/Spo0J family partition protein [Spartobacteria bacterium]|nr:ParB/RepB/Spo0J family partition protein [Spartobacteria bacterium]
MGAKPSGSRKNSGLGRGLGDLISQASASRTTVHTLQQGFHRLSVSQIRVPDHMPTRDAADDPLDKLTESIRAQGMLQPLLVRRERDAYVLVAGFRRLRASIKAGYEMVPAYVADISEKNAFDCFMAENAYRLALPAYRDDPLWTRVVAAFGVDLDVLDQWLDALHVPDTMEKINEAAEDVPITEEPVPVEAEPQVETIPAEVDDEPVKQPAAAAVSVVEAESITIPVEEPEKEEPTVEPETVEEVTGASDLESLGHEPIDDETSSHSEITDEADVIEEQVPKAAEPIPETVTPDTIVFPHEPVSSVPLTPVPFWHRGVAALLIILGMCFLFYHRTALRSNEMSMMPKPLVASAPEPMPASTPSPEMVEFAAAEEEEEEEEEVEVLLPSQHLFEAISQATEELSAPAAQELVTAAPSVIEYVTNEIIREVIKEVEVVKEVVRTPKLPEAFSLEPIAGIAFQPGETLFSVQFEDAAFVSRDQLNDASQSILMTLAEEIKPYVNDISVIITGHTDDDPVRSNHIYRDNYHLGLLRATAVAAMLQYDAGLDGKSIIVRSSGSDKAPYDNSKPGEKRKNRTVTVQIIPRISVL